MVQDCVVEVEAAEKVAALTVRERPAWAAELLQQVSTVVAPVTVVQEVVRIARSSVPGQWYDAREAFFALRELQAQTQDELGLLVLQFAEKVAALIYEAYQDMIDQVFYNPTSAENGQATTQELAQLLTEITAKVNNPEFAAKAIMLFNSK
jgi:hypothetical protein